MSSVMSGEGVLSVTEGVLKSLAMDVGLGWTASIVATTLTLRTLLTLPLMVSQLKTAARIELEAKPQVDAWRERIKGEIFREMREKGIETYKGLEAPQGDTKTDNLHTLDVTAFQLTYEARVKEKALAIYREHGYRPLRSLLLPLAQIPLWITLSLTLRRITAMPLPSFFSHPDADPHPAPLPGLSDAGFLWFTDLTVPDPTWVFPVIVGAGYLLNVELGLLSRKTELTRFQMVFTNSIRIISVFMIFVAKQVPMALTLYWATSALYSLGQNVAFKFPRVRRVFGIRETPSEKQTRLYVIMESVPWRFSK